VLPPIGKTPKLRLKPDSDAEWCGSFLLCMHELTTFLICFLNTVVVSVYRTGFRAELIGRMKIASQAYKSCGIG
jgi:hypothetical protein